MKQKTTWNELTQKIQQLAIQCGEELSNTLLQLIDDALDEDIYIDKRALSNIHTITTVINDKPLQTGITIINDNDELILPEDTDCIHCGGSIPTCCTCTTICERCGNQGWYLIQHNGRLKKKSCPRCTAK